MQAACNGKSACKGFVYGASEKCGYLKGFAAVTRSGWTAYRKKP